MGRNSPSSSSAPHRGSINIAVRGERGRADSGNALPMNPISTDRPAKKRNKFVIHLSGKNRSAPRRRPRVIVFLTFADRVCEKRNRFHRGQKGGDACTKCACRDAQKSLPRLRESRVWPHLTAGKQLTYPKSHFWPSLHVVADTP